MQCYIVCVNKYKGDNMREGPYYETLEEALQAIQHAYEDLIGHAVYQGLITRSAIIDCANAFVKSSCAKVLDNLGLLDGQSE
jgi:hypothetical protein